MVDKSELDILLLLGYNKAENKTFSALVKKRRFKMFFGENEHLAELLGVFKLTRKNSRIQSHPRSYDIISIRLNGSGLFKTQNDGEILPGKGDVLYIPHNTEYFQQTDGETIIAIHFINYSVSENNSAELYSFEKDSTAEVLLTNMYELWTEKKPGYKHECTSLFYHLLYIISRNLCTESLSESSISESMHNALDYIHKNYKREKICIKQLAKDASLSESYFRREFKKLYSVPPGQYIANLRAEYAAQLLQSKLYTVNEVAEKSGFEDTKYFSRFFKSKFGKSPSEYKNFDIEKSLS